MAISQWVNIGGGQFYREISIGISDTGLQSLKKDAIKQILKNILFLCCLYFKLKIECEIIAI